MRFSKFAQNSPQNDVHVKQVSISPFFGIVGDKKWSSFSNLGVGSPVFWPQIAKIGRFRVPKNGTQDAQIKKRRPLFVANYPKNGGIDSCFTRISFSGEFWANFENCVIKAHFWPISPYKNPKVGKVKTDKQIMSLKYAIFKICPKLARK